MGIRPTGKKRNEQTKMLQFIVAKTVNYKLYSNVRDVKMSENERIRIVEVQCCL